MECYIGDKKVRLNPYHMRKAIPIDGGGRRESDGGTGRESRVYLENGNVIKLNKRYGKVYLCKEDALYFTEVITNRILMPSEIILNKRKEIVGTICKIYVPNLGIESMFSMTKEYLLEELQELYKDEERLSAKEILLDDLHGKNISYHNGIYIIDYGCYKFKNNEYDDVVTRQLNKERLDEMLMNHFVLKALSETTHHQKAINTFKRIKKEKMILQCNTMEYLEKTMQDEDLGYYVKRMVKKI